MERLGGIVFVILTFSGGLEKFVHGFFTFCLNLIYSSLDPVNYNGKTSPITCTEKIYHE